MSRIIKIIPRVKRHRYLFIALMIVFVVVAIIIGYFVKWKIIGIKNTFGLVIVFIVTILICEVMLRLILKFNLGLKPFSIFLRYVYRQSAESFFPNQGRFPDFQYYWYHPFYHFALKSSAKLNQKAIEINALGFRGRERTQNDGALYNIYLSGDCQFLEQHLEGNKTFAANLEESLMAKKGVVVNNAGCPHYTQLHCLNRLIIDQNRVKIDLAILSAGINDVIVFLHSHNGQVEPDYTNFYKVFSEDRILRGFHDLWLVRNLRIIQLYKFFRIREWLLFDHSIESYDLKFQGVENVATARKIFFTDYYENYLRQYICLCRSLNIPLLLLTPKYNPADMIKTAQQFIAYGLERIIGVQKKLALEFNIPLIDCQNEMPSNAETIFNKWHLTGAGNEQRAKLVADFIERNFFSASL